MTAIRQSTAKTILVGPILDADGVAVTTGPVIGDIRLTKNGVVSAAAAAATLVHNHTGKWLFTTIAGNTDTVGLLQVSLNDGVNDMPVLSFNVIEEAVFDAMYAASAAGPLQSTTAGRKLDVNATGEAGFDLDNTSGTLDAAQLGADCITAAKIADNAFAAANFATGAFTADAFAANALVAATFAASSLNGKGNWNTVVPDASGTVPTLIGELNDFDPANDDVAVVTLVNTLTTYTGNTPQTGNSFTRIGVAGAGLTNINLPNQIMDITGDITGNLSGSVGSVTSKTGYSLVSTGLDNILVDGKTFPDAMQIIGATTSGNISGAGSGEETCKGLDGNTTRVVATVDEDGNRGMAYS